MPWPRPSRCWRLLHLRRPRQPMPKRLRTRRRQTRPTATRPRWTLPRRSRPTPTKWKKQKASMDVVAKRISEDRAVVEKWGQRAGLLGAFVGRAVDAFKGILTKRAATESARAAALALAQKTAAAAKLAASEERAAANRSKLARDAAVETARKQMREIEAERDKALQEVARLRPQGPKQGPIGPTMRR